MLKNPIRQFNNWFREAGRSSAIDDATAACLSTAGPGGFPDGRMVLLKDFDDRGFVFYTNQNSAKGQALKKNPRAALTFYWMPLHKQVRIQGKTELVSGAEADAYWKTRGRLSQLGAWASKQSQPLPSRATLLKDVAKLAFKFKLGPVPRPSFWTGFRLVPQKIEFWQGRANRLHDRFQYTPNKRGAWNVTRLYP
jgi:pyridoxamine 5'-phosphate oxidase